MAGGPAHDTTPPRNGFADSHAASIHPPRDAVVAVSTSAPTPAAIALCSPLAIAQQIVRHLHVIAGGPEKIADLATQPLPPGPAAGDILGAAGVFFKPPGDQFSQG
jgi:hypothetical protein